MTIYFTSDTHYYHANIIKYSKRPYKDVTEMNEMLIANHNSVVKPEDIYYHLGDFGFADQMSLQQIVRRLNGTGHLILGNHDKPDNFRGVMKWVGPYLEIRVPDKDAHQGHQKIILFHYSGRVWNGSHHGTWQLYGHSHGTLYNDPTLMSMDVGVDPCGYYPISYEDVKKLMKFKTFKPVDHHGTKK